MPFIRASPRAIQAQELVLVWDIGELILVGDSVSGFDMNSTLPAGVNRGGTFSVSPSGAPLPAGVSLSASGVLLADEGAQSTAGVVFAYDEPA